MTTPYKTAVLSWTEQQLTTFPIAQYNIWLSLNSFAYTLVDSVGATTFTFDYQILSTNTYSFYIEAQDVEGNLSPASNIVSPSWTNTVPNAPVLVSATLNSGIPDVVLDWNFSTAESFPIYQYQIFQSTNNITFNQIGAVNFLTNTYTDNTVTAGNTYYYYIVAVDTFLQSSANSNTLSVSFSSMWVETLSGSLGVDFLTVEISS